MADMMLFPDTVEEFMDQYKVTDTKQVYTNGTDLVPIYRMKQWFEHLQSAKPEALTDSEKRIFLAAMERERKICQAIDEALDNKECDAGLQYVCREIKRKVKGALWTI